MNRKLVISILNLFSDQTGYIDIQVEGNPPPTFKFYKVNKQIIF